MRSSGCVEMVGSNKGIISRSGRPYNGDQASPIGNIEMVGSK